MRIRITNKFLDISNKANWKKSKYHCWLNHKVPLGHASDLEAEFFSLPPVKDRHDGPHASSQGHERQRDRQADEPGLRRRGLRVQVPDAEQQSVHHLVTCG